MATDMMMMMMIDDIRLRVTVMIDTASRTQGRAAQKHKNGDTQHSLADLAASDKCLSHAAKSYVPIDRCIVSQRKQKFVQ